MTNRYLTIVFAVIIFAFLWIAMMMMIWPTSAEAGWRIYFKNSCAWSISASCAKKRATGKVQGPGETR
jgi:hypothetical protein